MAFRDKDPNRLMPKNGGAKIWNYERPTKQEQGLVPSTTVATRRESSLSFLDAAKGHDARAPLDASRGQHSWKLTPLYPTHPAPLPINGRAAALATPTSHQQPFFRPIDVPYSRPSTAMTTTMITMTTPPSEERPVARALSFSSPCSQEKHSSSERISFQIYQDDARNTQEESPRRGTALAPIVGISDSWEHGMLDSTDDNYKFLQTGRNSPLSLGADDSLDYDQAELLTNDMFRLLGIEEGTAPSGNDESRITVSTIEPPVDTAMETTQAFKQKDQHLAAEPNGPIVAETLLFEMWAEIKDKFNIDDLIPFKGPMSRADYANVISDHVASKTAAGAERAKYILIYLLRLYKLGISNVRPDGGCYNKVIHGFAEARLPLQAEGIMNLMCTMFDEGDKLAQPNTRHYTTLLYAWQRSKTIDAPEHCEEILEKMHELHQTRAMVGCKPDAFTYTTVLHCWADSGRPDAARRAEALFRKMKEYVERGDQGLVPDAVAYSNLINAIVSGRGYARAADILWEMVDDFLKGNTKCKPRIRNLNTILAVWSKSNAPYGPEQAEDIVRQWLHLNKTTTMCVKPDSYTYCLLLKCWSASPRADGPLRAEQTLFWLEKLHKEGDVAAELNTIKYTTVLTAWIARKKWKTAFTLFDKMANDFLAGNKGAKPDCSTFQKILDGLCTTSMVNEADALTRTMWTLSFNAGDDVTYSCAPVIKAWGYAGSPERAEFLLKDMQHLYKTGRLYPGPTKQLYRLVMSAWEKSKAHDRSSRIRSLGATMERLFPQGSHQQIVPVKKAKAFAGNIKQKHHNT